MLTISQKKWTKFSMTINRLLTDEDRINMAPLISNMWRVCPDMMRRKIERANVQQAFVLDTVIKEGGLGGKSIISVGCYDDTAYECLRLDVANIIGIDPTINQDLHTFRQNHSVGFEIAFSTSVLEHVEDDLQFVEDMCTLLLPSGLGILTMDFNDSYKLGDRLPQSDLRFYTKQDLYGLRFIINKLGCELVDTPDWSGEPEFTHDGCTYSFCTFVFRKTKDV